MAGLFSKEESATRCRTGGRGGGGGSPYYQAGVGLRAMWDMLTGGEAPKTQRQQELDFTYQIPEEAWGNPTALRQYSRMANQAGFSGLAGNMFQFSFDVEKNLSKEHDIPQPRKESIEALKKMIRREFSGGYMDFGEPENLPEGYDTESAAYEIFSIQQKENITPSNAVKKFKEYALSEKKPSDKPKAPVVGERPF